MTNPTEVTKSERRIAAAFDAIAKQLHPLGWRMAKGAHRALAWRTWCATYRRLCENADVDALAVHLSMHIAEDPHVDLERFVSTAVSELSSRPQGMAIEPPDPERDAGDHCRLPSYSRDPDLFADDALKAETKRWYASYARSVAAIVAEYEPASIAPVDAVISRSAAPVTLAAGDYCAAAFWDELRELMRRRDA